MAGMCCGVVGETEATSAVEPSGVGRRHQMEIHQLKFFATASDVVVPLQVSGTKRRKVDCLDVTDVNSETKALTVPLECENDDNSLECEKAVIKENNRLACSPKVSLSKSPAEEAEAVIKPLNESRFGVTMVCGRRRDMEDAVAVKPSFTTDLNFYGVYDGHGCSHVAVKCKDRMHEIVKSEVETGGESLNWSETLARSFARMDKEVTDWSEGASSSNCRCELQTPQCDAVGSTAVVAVVTLDKIVVSNCGDSRAVLCRNGVAIPLSTDHKPDRPDELARIEKAGGRVIYWDGARVLGVLAMSRAIGDNYLKPYVIPEPEVTVTDRTVEDECLILASDGLWDVVSNDVACSVARMCLKSQKPPSHLRIAGNDVNVAGGEISDKACSDASILLTKLALARQSSDNVCVVVVDLRRNQ
ncbi:protein phosphatase 2C 37-like [Bidens hawaiensis]|uniref:protein phosphatase 2C 37-like n=1 Tax=Bidens hawaiensis TaxID=980011 RepID=UPI00404AE0BE